MKIIYNNGTVDVCPAQDELHVLRHTAAHILAQAVKRRYPQAIFAYGPATDNGFYYDVDLGEEKLGEEDLVMITADHGCDPAYTATTDHTREYVPLLILGKNIKPVNLGTRKSFSDIAATVTELLGVPYECPGKSFAKEVVK